MFLAIFFYLSLVVFVMQQIDLIIIGAGACGLVAARELTREGKKVIIAEARDRVGGRIYSFTGEGFSEPMEAGAEFIHGDLPITINLLREAGITFQSMEGETYRIKKSEIQKSEEFIEGLRTIISKMNELKQDISLGSFIDIYLNDEKYETARQSLKKFVEGYDAADIYKVSTLSLKEEWTGGGTSVPYIIPHGYGQLIEYLEEEVRAEGEIIHLSAVVKEVHWEKGLAKVITANEKTFTASKVLITVPLGVLQSDGEMESFIRFTPEIPQIIDAAQSIGFGPVIKVLIEFRKAFWVEKQTMPDLGFVISDAEVPVWWTRHPAERPLLTGWLGGPEAEKFKNRNDEEILNHAINSLSYIFKISNTDIEDLIVAKKVVNWVSDPYSRGAYGYDTLASGLAKKTLNQSIENTVFFAGEAVSEKSPIGTVEAALASGMEAGRKIKMALNGIKIEM